MGRNQDTRLWHSLARPVVLFAVGVASWAVAILVETLASGLVLALANPFTYWLAFFEAIEFLVWLAGGGDLGFFLANATATREGILVLVGLFGIVGWLTTGAAIVRLRGYASRRFVAAAFVLNVLFNPLVSTAVTAVHLRSGHTAALKAEPEATE